LNNASLPWLEHFFYASFTLRTDPIPVLPVDLG